MAVESKLYQPETFEDRRGLEISNPKVQLTQSDDFNESVLIDAQNQDKNQFMKKITSLQNPYKMR